MVRPAAAADTNAFNKLKSLSLFHPDGQLKKEAYIEPDGSSVWKNAAALTKINKTSLYLDILQNRRNLRTDLEIAAGIRPKRKRGADISSEVGWNNEIERLKTLIDEEDSDRKSADDDLVDAYTTDEIQSDDSEYEEYNSFDTKTRNPHNCNPLKFTIKLNQSAWLEIKPRNGKLPGFCWTPVVVRHICLKIPHFRCAHRFRVGKVYKTLPDKYFDFYANCKECKTYLYGVCKQKPEEDSHGVEIDISTYDTRHITHKKRRPIFSIERRKAAQTLKYVKAAKYKSDLINERMDYSDYEPPDMCTTYNYRRIRVEGMNEYIGLSGPKDVLESLFYLAENFSFIKEICTFPLRVWYWARCQIEMWDSLEEITDLNPVITVDAKGSLVKKSCVDDEKSSHIFLYQLLTTVESKYAPLSQMISSRHDTNVTTRWLMEWVKSVKHLPRQSVCDGALGLLNSLCWALNNCVYKVFCATCLLLLLGNIKVLPFKCLLTLDRPHFVKSICRWPALAVHKDVTVRDFYVRSLAFASTCDNFQEIRKIMVSLFIICESKYMPLNSECYNRFVWLKQKFATLEHDPVNNSKDNAKGSAAEIEIETSLEEIEEEFDNNGVLIWLKSLHTEALGMRTMSGDLNTLPNKFQCPQVKDNLMYTFSQFVSWSKVMHTAFGIKSEIVATSASNESYFKDLVHTHGFSYPVSANKFVKHHMLVINAQIIAARAKVKSKYGNGSDRPKIVEEQLSASSCTQNEIVCDSQDLKENIDICNKVTAKGTRTAYSTRTKAKCEPACADQDTRNSIVKKTDLHISDHVSNTKMNATLNTRQKLECKVPSAEEIKKSKSTKNSLVGCNYHYPLKNGGYILIEEKLLLFTNTCAYDSIFEVFSYLYQTYTKVKGFIDTASTTNDFFMSTADYSKKIVTMDDIYETRAQLLYPLANKKTTGLADCECNVNALIDILLKDQCPIQRHVKCNNCLHTRIENRRSLIVQEAAAARAFEKCQANPANNFLHLCIAETLSGDVLNCRKCNLQTAITQLKLETYVSFEFERIFEIYKGIPIEQVPLKIRFDQNDLNLCSFIFYRPKVKGRVGHYIGYCYNKSKSVWEIHDDTTDSYSYTKNIPENIFIATLFYVIDDQ